MSLTVTITAETGREFAAFLRKQVRAAHDVLDARNGKRRGARLPLREMSLALVGDRKMSELHEEFMGIHGPTDVLTFPIDEDASGRVTSGEVIVSVPQARREAKRHRIAPRLELLLYAIHGMLHLVGYDDRTARGFHTMHAVEDDILTKLGFGPVFTAAADGTGTSARRRSQADPARRQRPTGPRRAADNSRRTANAPSRGARR